MAEGTLPFEYLVKRWPVSVETEVISHRTSGAVVVLVAHADGHLSLHIRTYSKSLTEHFQVVRLPVGEYVKIAIAWKSELADLAVFIGGRQLEAQAGKAKEPLDITRTASRQLSIPGFSIPEKFVQSLPHNQWLFVETLVDLTKRLGSNRRYDGLRISALVRQLICDQTPLYVKANSETKVPIMFRVRKKANWGHAVGTPPQISWVNLCPSENEEYLDVKADPFLATPVLLIEETKCTTLDVINAVAHVLGGVHVGRALTSAAKALIDRGDQIQTPSGELTIAAMQDIGIVTLHALLPLAKTICGVSEDAKMKF